MFPWQAECLQMGNVLDKFIQAWKNKGSYIYRLELKGQFIYQFHRVILYIPFKFFFIYLALLPFFCLTIHAIFSYSFLLSADFFFQNQLFRKILSGIPSECQTVWTQIRPDILLVLICV